MIKISITLLTISAIIAAVVYYRFPKSSVLRPLAYTGTARCNGCHSTEASGNQAGIWAASAHASAYITLLSDRAQQYTDEHNKPKPTANPSCLRCHTTAYDALPERKSSGYRVEEGVSCEQCHGPGSDYSTETAMNDKRIFLKLGGIAGTEHDCMQCHALSLQSDHCPFQTKPFDLISAMASIAHPYPKKTNTASH